MSAGEETERRRPAFACRACGAAERRRTWELTERMFGYGDRFDYGECARCGAVSIATVPADLNRFYPAKYYAFAAPASTSPAGRSWRGWLLGDKPEALTEQVIALLPDKAARVLDVGSGSGALLARLHAAGGRNLSGVDPHLPPEAEQTAPFALRRGTIEDCPGDWDLIMYHHVLEHIATPGRELVAAAARLRPGGRLLIRVPLADSWATRRYGVDWVQWDAPRHLWLPTHEAMQRLAAAAGLRTVRTWDDATFFQQWGSERHARGLTARATPGGGSRAGLLAAMPGVIAGRLRARWLNWRRQGDQGAFVLEKPAAGSGR